MRRLLFCLALIAALSTVGAISLASPAPAPGTDAGELTQNVVADNSQGGTVLAMSGMHATSADGKDDASPSNLAQANSHDCATPCQAIAAAFQIVLVPSGASNRAPQNVALATNINCSHCGAFAYAYQYVVEVNRGAKLSGHARQQIAGLRREADQDVHAGLDYPALDSKLHVLATRFRGVVDGDLRQQNAGEHNKKSNQTVREHPAG